MCVALKRLFLRCLASLYIVKKFSLKRFTVTLATISAHAHMPKYKFQCACPVTYVYSIYIPKSQFASQVCGSLRSPIIEMINSSRHDTMMMIIMMLFLTIPYCSSSFRQFKWSTSSPQFQSTFSHTPPPFFCNRLTGP